MPDILGKVGGKLDRSWTNFWGVSISGFRYSKLANRDRSKFEPKLDRRCSKSTIFLYVTGWPVNGCQSAMYDIELLLSRAGWFR